MSLVWPAEYCEPKVRLLTTCDRLAMGGKMFWNLAFIWMWKFPGTLQLIIPES